MIDLHTHTIFSDGELLPSELVRRARVKGYDGVAMTDHGDASNIDFFLPRIAKVCGELNSHGGIRAMPGVELTHVPPPGIAGCVQEARKLGARVVIVHGETIVEPVEPGTNLAAIEAGVDILSHPGLITLDEARLAAERSVYLEITSRKGHSLTNGHVVNTAREAGAKLVINNDAHGPGDLLSHEELFRVGLGAGLTEEEGRAAFENSKLILERGLQA